MIDGTNMKGKRIVIPLIMPGQMLEQLQSSHMAIENNYHLPLFYQITNLP